MGPSLLPALRPSSAPARLLLPRRASRSPRLRVVDCLSHIVAPVGKVGKRALA